MIAGKNLLGHTNLFSPNDYLENDKIIYQYFKDKYGKIKRKTWIYNKKIHKTRSYLSEEVKHNDTMSEKPKKVCRALNYFEHFLVFVSYVSVCVSISAFASLVGVPVGVTSSAVGIKIYAITAGI